MSTTEPDTPQQPEPDTEPDDDTTPEETVPEGTYVLD